MSGIVDIEELGRRIRKLRLERRMTLKEVERASALSATHLSEIERGRTSPTIGALVRIARALGRNASYFIEADERADVAHLAREQMEPAPLPEPVSALRTSAGVPGSRVFTYRIRLPRAAELALAAQEQPGDALYLVRGGRVEGEFGGSRHVLEAGDAVQTSVLRSHSFRAVGDEEESELIAILTCPLEHVAAIPVPEGASA